MVLYSWKGVKGMRKTCLLPAIFLMAIASCQKAELAPLEVTSAHLPPQQHRELLTGLASAQQETPITIVYSSQASGPERLAAKEIRRYLYLRTGKLLPIVRYNRNLDFETGLIIIGRKDRDIIKRIQDNNAVLTSSITALKPQHYQIKTLKSMNKPVVLICGGDEFGTLYGAYRFIEHFGVRFYLHGDVLPDKKISLKMPDLEYHIKVTIDDNHAIYFPATAPRIDQTVVVIQ